MPHLPRLSFFRRRANHARGFLATLMLILMSISQVSSQTMSAELLEEPHAKEAISQTDATEALATAEPVWLERLASDPKLLNTQAILAPFARGEAETAVIVTLEPTPAAHDLATQSADALNRPSAFDLTESPVFFDLQDQTIRTQLRETVTQAVGQFIANQPKAGLTVTQRFSYQFGFAARVSPAALEQLLADPAVLRVEEDGLMEPHLRQGIPLIAADTPSATFTGSGLSIAIVDTGIDTSHPQLGGGSSIFNSKVIGGYDTGDNDADPRPNSNTGEAHGTACAGIAAGDLGDSGDYIGGVAPGAKLYALKITAGDGGSASDSAMIAAWEWAISHKNDDPANPILVISTSFGGGGYSSACDSYKPGLTTAAANAVAAGITIFASSGNDGFCSYISSPACISHVNSVGAVYDANIGDVGFCVNASYSCATPQYSGYCSSGYNAVFENTAADKVTAYSNSASFLTLFAPSHNAYTTDIKGAGGYASGDYDDAFGGTSAACPYAAGAAAVLQSAAKAKTGSYLTPAQVKSYLTSYGTTITDGKVTSVQKPRINLASAVNALPLTQSTVSVTASDPTATETDLTTGTFTFSRTGDTSAALTVNYTVSGSATAGSDYTALGTSVTFAAGSDTATQTVTPVQDTLIEADETVILTLSAGTGYTVGSPASATVTLTSDDPQDHTLTVTMEGTGTGRITSSPAGIDCGGDCSQSYANDSTIVLTASPGGGSDFAGWSGSCLGLATNCAIYLDEVKQVSASFTQRQNHSPTFELGDGQVLTPISLSATINDLALQPDGKIVAVGSSQNYNGGPTDLALARYNADGSLDTTFGTGGKLITSLTEYSDGGFSVIVQPDGKIVIGGYGGEHYTDSDPLDFALVRYLPDGSLDTSFATNGVVLLPPLAGANRWGFDLALQPDGKILFGGAQLVRFLSDGSLDATFGHNGQLAPVTDGSRTKIALQPDGKILVAGNTVGTNHDFALERYNRDGSLDTSFATSGKLTLDIQGYRDDVEDLALQIDGKILLAGFSTDADGNEDFALVRLNSDGSLDTGFGNDGMVTTELGALQERGHSMALQPDGKILVGGMYRCQVPGDYMAFF